MHLLFESVKQGYPILPRFHALDFATAREKEQILRRPEVYELLGHQSIKAIRKSMHTQRRLNRR